MQTVRYLPRHITPCVKDADCLIGKLLVTDLASCRQMNAAVLHTSPSRRETGVPSRHSCPDGCIPRCCFILLSVENSVIGLLNEPMHGLRDAEHHKSTPQEVRAMIPCHQWTTQTIVSNDEIGIETQLVSSSATVGKPCVITQFARTRLSPVPVKKSPDSSSTGEDRAEDAQRQTPETKRIRVQNIRRDFTRGSVSLNSDLRR